MEMNPPTRETPKLEGSVIEWLLDADPSIRWQVMQDLLGAPADEVAAERGRVAIEGLGAELLCRPGRRWAVGRRGLESRLELHYARSATPAGYGTRSYERAGTPGGGTRS